MTTVGPADAGDDLAGQKPLAKKNLGLVANAQGDGQLQMATALMEQRG